MKQAQIKEILGELGDAIAGVIDPDHGRESLDAEILKASETSTALKLTIGTRTAFAKLFHPGTAGHDAFARERQALELLNGAQVPRLLFVAEGRQLMVTQFIDGVSIGQSVNAQNAMLTAEHLGQWFGSLAGSVPSETSDETWASYLMNYESGLNAAILERHASVLANVPVGRLVFSHNDNALGNFILTPEKRLFAVDFADCRMKPEGWDLLTSARALFLRCPEELQSVAAALLRGYRLAATDSGLQDDFDNVISALVVANILQSARENP